MVRLQFSIARLQFGRSYRYTVLRKKKKKKKYHHQLWWWKWSIYKGSVYDSVDGNPTEDVLEDCGQYWRERG